MVQEAWERCLDVLKRKALAMLTICSLVDVYDDSPFFCTRSVNGVHESPGHDDFVVLASGRAV